MAIFQKKNFEPQLPKVKKLNLLSRQFSLLAGCLLLMRRLCGACTPGYFWRPIGPLPGFGQSKTQTGLLSHKD